MLCVSEKTVYRRLEENGMSVRGTYAKITDQELDDIVKNMLREFSNSGYKSMRGHLLSRGYKVQENRIREAMRRTDPEGTVVRALVVILLILLVVILYIIRLVNQFLPRACYCA